MPIAPLDPSPYLEDSSGYKGFADRVLVPSDINELQVIIRESSANKVPITIAGAGTGLTGARVPQGGWSISLERFRTLEIKEGKARCGAGIALSELQVAAAKTKQFFGPNPTEISASVGGIISTNAGGARSFRFGSVRHHVLALQVTFSDGQTRELKRGDLVNFPYQTLRQPATTKNAAGYYLQPNLQWVDLLSGSEGTLGIVTEAELQLLPEPAAILSGVVFFPSEEHALDAVDAWRTIPRLRLLESMDGRALDLLRPRYSDIPSIAEAALLIEQDLHSEEDEEIDLWTERLGRQSALQEQSWFGFSAADRERFRAFRHALPTMIVDKARRGNTPKFGTDFAVPIGRNRELYRYYRQRCSELFPDQYTIFGHIGDANVHVNLLPNTPKDAERAEELMEDFARYVVSLGGTIAAEHGVGKHKTNLLQLMYSPEEIEVMRDVKRKLDPNWLLGRGTIFT
ncbi:MAG: FAD-binding oxidoreductase [Acidobacteriaceae bacterium]|nr:FAD-binding oxidoreductase [Acidobacteriaceae bacterium]